MMNVKKIIKIIVCVFVCVILVNQFSAQTPFGGVRRFIWEWKHKETDKTWIDVTGNEMIKMEEGVLAEYKDNTYYLDYEKCEYGQVYRINHEGNKYIIEGLNRYINENMVFSWAVKDEEYLLIIGENYLPSSWAAEEGVYSNGLVGFYKGASIVAIDMQESKMVEEQSITNGKVVYIDKKQYIVLEQEKVKFYQLSTGKLLREEQVNWFEKDKEYWVNWNSFENWIEFFCWNDEKYESIGRFNLE